MWLPDLADPAWAGDVLSRHADQLGIPDDVAAVDLVDVRLTHPHRPGSPLCRGWATYLVRPRASPSFQLYLKGFPDRLSSEAAWQQDRAARPSGHREHLPGHDLVVWRFPEDPTLRALPELLPPRLRRADLPAAVAQALSLVPGSEPLDVAVVRYQPEASATLRVAGGAGDPAPTAYVKHLPAGTVPAVAARHEALWATRGPGQPLRVAEPLASDPERSLLWTRGVAGVPLTVAVPPGDLPDVAGVTGALLAGLHGSGVEAAPIVSLSGLLEELGKKAAKIGRAHPAVEGRVAELVVGATSRRDAVRSERRCTLHGDFHLDQLVTSEEGPVLVDLDSMMTGPPEVDLAEFLVDTALRGLPPTIAEQVGHELLSAYTAAAGAAVDAAALALCADAEFVNRCYRHLRRHTQGWEADLEEELGRYDDLARLLGR